MRTRYALLSVFVLSLSTQVGCKKFLTQLAQGRDAGAVTATPTKAIDPAEARANKAAAYIGCANSYNNSVGAGKRFYLARVNEKTGPTGKEGDSIFVSELADISACVKAAAEAKTKAPSMPDLEAAGDAYIGALKKLAALLAEGHRYYEGGDFKDDKFAKGKALHPKLVVAWKEFDDVASKLGVITDKIEDDSHVAELARLQKDSARRFQYLAVKMLADGKKLIRAATGADDPMALDLDTYTPLLTTFEADETELRTYASSHEAEVNKIVFMGADSLVSSATSFLNEAKEIMRRKRDKKKLTRSEIEQLNGQAAFTVHGTPAAAIHAYNTLIEASNRLKYL